MSIRVLSVFGTRPEAIKMAPLMHLLQSTEGISHAACFTGQHRDLPLSVLDAFHIKADYNLHIMEEAQSLSGITSRILLRMDEMFTRERPDLVLVHGDTSTTLAGALSAYFHKIPVGHVEAGLRTFDKMAPWPEEMNRTLVGDIADLHFCPTLRNKENLEHEGVRGQIFVTGNTVVDVMRTTVRTNYVFSDPKLNAVDFTGKRVITLTCHRKENYGRQMEEIFTAVRMLLDKHEDVAVICPVHPAPAVKEYVIGILGGIPRVHLIEPCNVFDMHNLLARSFLVMTDSGGLQEEAPALGKPVLVLRNNTERPEAVEAGTVRIAGTRTDTVLSAAEELLNDEIVYHQMAHAISPYGDGNASERIVQGILWYFGLAEDRPLNYQ